MSGGPKRRQGFPSAGVVEPLRNFKGFGGRVGGMARWRLGGYGPARLPRGFDADAPRAGADWVQFLSRERMLR